MLTSDTIYTTKTYAPLCSLIKRHLAPGGVAVVGAKRFYFGTNGNVNTFAAALKAAPYNMACESVAVFEDGASNIREVLLVTHSS